MTYNVASDIKTRNLVWVDNIQKIQGDCVTIARINRKASQLLTSKGHL